MSMECYFCGETNQIVLQRHHIIPKSIDNNSTQTVILCANCHIKIHRLLDGVMRDVSIEDGSMIEEEVIDFENLPPSPDAVILKIFNELVEEHVAEEGQGKFGGMVNEEELIDAVAKEGVSRLGCLAWLEKQKRNGLIYCPKPGHYKKT